MPASDLPPNPGYPLGHGPAELARLQRQAAIHAEFTERVLRRAGIATGLRVLDLGTGVGDVALLAARLVGERGAVLGIDGSAQAIATARVRAEAAGLPWVQFEIADLAGFASARRFDALVGRLVLLYQPDPAALLCRLRTFLEPGAIAAFIEMDMSGVRAIPPLPLLTRCGEWVLGAFRHGGVELDMGSRLFATFRAAGVADPRMTGMVPVEAGPESEGYWLIADTVRSLLPAIERAGLASAAEIEVDTLEQRLREAAVAGDHCLLMPTMIGAWGRFG